MALTEVTPIKNGISVGGGGVLGNEKQEAFLSSASGFMKKNLFL